MYGLLTPREPVNEKLGWLDNPKNMGLLHAALGILANNSGHYGALAPALGTGGLLGLQAAMGTQQQNVQNRRNNRIDARRDYFSREEMDLRKKEFGLMQEEAGLFGRSEYGQPQQVTQAAPAITPQQAPQPYSEAGFQGQLAATGGATAPEVEVTATPLLQMEQYRRMAETAYARAQRNAPFGSNKKVKAMIDADMAAAKSYADKADRLEANLEQTTVGGIPGITFNKTEGRFYENGSPITAERVQELATKQAESGASNISLFAPQPGVDAQGNSVFFQPNKRGGAPTIVPGVTPKPPEGYNKQKSGVDSVLQSMNAYKSALTAQGGRLDRVTPQKRLQLGTLYNDMMLQAKEAYNLGVLNGPDYEILQQVIKNPLDATSMIYSAEDLKKQVDTFASVMGRVRQSIDTSYGQKPQPEKKVTKIMGDADYDKLPSGAEFIGPDGVKRRKP